MNFEFHPEAEDEFIEQAARYDSEVVGLGARFGDEVYRVIELLLENPRIGAPVDENLYHFVLRGFPHSVVYAVVADTLFIVAVAHGSRKPGYWRSRTGR